MHCSWGAVETPPILPPSSPSPNPLPLLASYSSSLAELGGLRGGSIAPSSSSAGYLVRSLIVFEWVTERVRLVDLCPSHGIRGLGRVKVFSLLGSRAIRVKARSLVLGVERCRLRGFLPRGPRGERMPISSSRGGTRTKFLVFLAMLRNRKSKVRIGEWPSSKSPEFSWWILNVISLRA